MPASIPTAKKYAILYVTLFTPLSTKEVKFVALRGLAFAVPGGIHTNAAMMGGKIARPKNNLVILIALVCIPYETRRMESSPQ